MVKNNIQKTQFESEMKNFISLIKKHEQISDKEIEDSWDKPTPLFPSQKEKSKSHFPVSACRMLGCSLHSHHL